MILLSVSDAAYFAKLHGHPVPASTIRRWVHEKRLVRYGEERDYKVDHLEVEKVTQALGVQRNRKTRRAAA